MLIYSPETKGKFFRKAANLTTRSSTGVALAMATNIATNDKLPYINSLPGFQTWGMAICMGAIAVADKVDGTFARTAHRFGNLISRKHKNMDPFHDKVRHHAITLASSFALAQSNVYLGAAMATVDGITLVRDVKKTIERKNAPEAIDTQATKFTKIKTGELGVADIVTVAPLSAHPVDAAASLALHTVGACMSWLSSGVAENQPQLPISEAA